MLSESRQEQADLEGSCPCSSRLCPLLAGKQLLSHKPAAFHYFNILHASVSQLHRYSQGSTGIFWYCGQSPGRRIYHGPAGIFSVPPSRPAASDETPVIPSSTTALHLENMSLTAHHPSIFSSSPSASSAACTDQRKTDSPYTSKCSGL